MIPLLKSFEEQVRPEHTALLVIDMQNDFCAEGGYLHKERNYDVAFARGVASNIATVVAAARQANMPVVWISRTTTSSISRCRTSPNAAKRAAASKGRGAPISSCSRPKAMS